MGKKTLKDKVVDVNDPAYLKELLQKALPFLESYDLMGTGGLVDRSEYGEMNMLEKEIAEAIGENSNDYGFHNSSG